tara:strand:+ start:312 stop:689 length:378 start_codon:yes stop_codon:yes gene_type:complete
MKKAKPTYTTVPWKSLDDPDKFRDADRIEEAQRIPLTETQKMDADYLKSLEDAAEASKLAQKKEHKLRLDAELETSLVKAVGQNSPEMKALKKEVEELKADLARAKEDHQFDNLVHKRELEKMRK